MITVTVELQIYYSEKHDIKLEILHKHKPFEQIRDPESCDVRVFFYEGFSPGHVIITTIIINLINHFGKALNLILNWETNYAILGCLISITYV